MNDGRPSELRAASAWGLGDCDVALHETPLIDLMADDDEFIAVHALVAASRLIDDGCVRRVLSDLGDNPRRSAGLVRAVLASRCDPVGPAIEALQTAGGSNRQWLLYLLACLGRYKCEAQVSSVDPALTKKLDFFWRLHVENWTNRLDVADQIDYQRSQVLE